MGEDKEKSDDTSRHAYIHIYIYIQTHTHNRRFYCSLAAPDTLPIPKSNSYSFFSYSAFFPFPIFFHYLSVASNNVRMLKRSHNGSFVRQGLPILLCRSRLEDARCLGMVRGMLTYTSILVYNYHQLKASVFLSFSLSLSLSLSLPVIVPASIDRYLQHFDGTVLLLTLDSHNSMHDHTKCALMAKKRCVRSFIKNRPYPTIIDMGKMNNRRIVMKDDRV